MTDFVIDHTPAPYTSEDAYAEETLREMLDKASVQINTLEREVERLTNNWEYVSKVKAELLQKIDNVKGIFLDLASEGEEITETLSEIARMLDISLTREVNVSVTVTFSGTATVPLDMNIDDIASDVSFSFDEGYGSDIEWDISEDDQDWDIQEDY